MLKAKYRNDQDKINEEGMTECGFLFTYYTDIYNKIRKDEIDLKILNQFLNVLRRIEDGELDQHDGAFIVGTLLKEIYVDSALRKAAKLNENQEQEEQNDTLEPGEKYKQAGGKAVSKKRKNKGKRKSAKKTKN
jgi:hypothetical protein